MHNAHIHINVFFAGLPFSQIKNIHNIKSSRFEKNLALRIKSMNFVLMVQLTKGNIFWYELITAVLLVAGGATMFRNITTYM